MGKCIRTFIVGAIAGGMLGLVIYSIIEHINAIVACCFAGLLIAIATGAYYYVLHEWNKPIQNDTKEGGHR